MISIISHQLFIGPNIYAPEATLVAELAFDDPDGSKLIDAVTLLGEISSDWWTMPARSEGELWALYVARLLAEWSLAALNKDRGFLRHCGARPGDNGKVLLWLGYHNPQTSLDALRLGIGFLTAFAQGRAQAVQVKPSLSALWRKCRATHPDYQARILMEAAVCQDIPYSYFLPALRLWQFGWGRRALKFFESSSQEDSFAGAQIAQNKVISKRVLASFGAPTLPHVLVQQAAQLEDAAAKVGWPCVLKPIDRGQAKGVTVNIRSLDRLREAFDSARSLSTAPLMVEAMATGAVYRLLVVRGQLVAASRRSPASVEADGTSTALQLAEAFNRERAKGEASGRGVVPIDNEFDSTLAEQDLVRDSVPPAGQQILLRTIPLLGTGSENVDVTGMVHEDTRTLVESMAESLGLAVVGFDYLTPDIALSCHEVGSFLEFNLTPSLRGHMVHGKDIHGVAAAVLGPQPARLPSVLIIASDELTASLMEPLAAVQNLGWRVGDAAGVGALRLKLNTKTPSAAFFALTANKRVNRIIFVCTPEELVRHGMIIDKPDLVVADFEALGDGWEDVLRAQAGDTRALPGTDGLIEALAPYLSEVLQ